MFDKTVQGLTKTAGMGEELKRIVRERDFNVNLFNKPFKDLNSNIQYKIKSHPKMNYYPAHMWDGSRTPWDDRTDEFKLKLFMEMGVNWKRSNKIALSDLPLDQSGEMKGWIAIYNGKKVEILKSEAKDLWGAKQLALKKLNVPKSKSNMMAIEPAY